MRRLEGKIALVTGGAKGQEEAFSKLFARWWAMAVFD